ncbi:MAG: hypothetical protein C6W56_08085 [Caldibacillus debilis]|nr:MAG: hypothetical protein C6W56_08085 [Caldibacillus debilis]
MGKKKTLGPPTHPAGLPFGCAGRLNEVPDDPARKFFIRKGLHGGGGHHFSKDFTDPSVPQG